MNGIRDLKLRVLVGLLGVPLVVLSVVLAVLGTVN